MSETKEIYHHFQRLGITICEIPDPILLGRCALGIALMSPGDLSTKHYKLRLATHIAGKRAKDAARITLVRSSFASAELVILLRQLEDMKADLEYTLLQLPKGMTKDAVLAAQVRAVATLASYGIIVGHRWARRVLVVHGVARCGYVRNGLDQLYQHAAVDATH